ncbi:MAG: dienelactone hydrolase family protein [Opitutaceae bacterium]|nr:dienelactone hydrolase family protein [Opitutaceae bacterium]
MRPFAPTVRRLALVSGLLLACAAPTRGAASEPLPGTALLTGHDDLSEQMAAGIGRYFERAAVLSVDGRAEFWRPDFSSPTAYDASVAPNRARFTRMIGAVEPRLPVRDLDYVGTHAAGAPLAATGAFTVHAVRWPLFDGVHGEGLLLQPTGAVVARVVAIPDADQTPEAIAGLGPLVAGVPAFARRLAENGCQVLVPALIDRAATHSGNPRLKRFTNQPHREWLYRQAFTFGRHLIGLEVQKVSAAVDWLAAQGGSDPAARGPVGVAGWGEGGLLALYSAAVDTRIAAALVSGYFDRRERVWTEPLYRNLQGLLREFGDAEIAQLVVPRTLIIEHARAPQVDGPPPALAGVPARLGASAAPGRIVTPVFADVADEFVRAQHLAGSWRGALQFRYRDHDRPAGSESDRTLGPLADGSLLAFLQRLAPGVKALAAAGPDLLPARAPATLAARQERQLGELERYLQGLIARSRVVRDAFLWQPTRPTTPEAWRAAMGPFRETFWNDLNGRLPAGAPALNPRSRPILDRPAWRGYEVTLDLGQPGLFAWGYLLLPKNLQPGERRPVIVAQHGGGGVPATVIDETPATHRTYKAFAVQLVERGFVVFAPHFPWRTSDRFFRVNERKANAVGMTNFAVLLEQHRRLLDWLTAQPWVDPQRIGFYGLSWGGKAALRVPAVEERYALSVCSGDFNEWIWKSATTEWGNSYMFVPEYETLNFNLGLTFGHAEMAALIAPRAFMVERGHADGVGIDEWVAFEYARVNRLYNQLKIPERTQIEFFDGGHEIRAVGTFKFIHRQFNWPEP